ncbi:MAG: hypothetical protein J5I98_25670 [Phaeodactylibacter sp.]|nr:hypothetical protein [Phaeodactylibacter sp.]
MRNLKIITAVFSLVGIGFVAGFFTHRYVAVQQIHRVAEMRFASGFEGHLYRIIDADAEQQSRLHPIVQRYAGQIAENHIAARARRRILVDSMHLEIKPLLSPEQVQKLDDFSRRFHEHKKKKDKKKKDKDKKKKNKKNESNY